MVLLDGQTAFHALDTEDLQCEVRKFVGILMQHLFKVIDVLLQDYFTLLKADKIGYFDMGFKIRKFQTIGVIKGSCWRISGVELQFAEHGTLSAPRASAPES